MRFAQDHPAAGQPMYIDAFLGLEHLLVTPEGDRFEHTDTLHAERGLKRSLAITLTQMYAAPALIAQSDLIGMLMRGVVEVSGFDDRLAILAPPIPLEACPMSWSGIAITTRTSHRPGSANASLRSHSAAQRAELTLALTKSARAGQPNGQLGPMLRNRDSGSTSTAPPDPIVAATLESAIGASGDLHGGG